MATFNSYDEQTNPCPVYKTSTELRHKMPFMLEVSAAALQQKIRDFQEFKTNYFSKTRKKTIGRCGFKKKLARQSYRLPNQKFKLDVANQQIALEKIGKVRVVVDRNSKKDCSYRSVTISRDRYNCYFVSVLVDELVEPTTTSTGKSVGIDLGLRTYVTLSTGEKIENPRWLRENQAKLRTLQKHLSRKVKGSSRREKCRRRVAALHWKIANQRKHFHHVLAMRLVKEFDHIGIEDLRVSNMVRNHNLSKSISDAGWSQFATFLKYKAAWENKIVQPVDTFFASSKLCSVCGTKHKDLEMKDEHWTCTICRTLHDRDYNAAINIERESLRTAQGVACALRTQSRCKTSSLLEATCCEAPKKPGIHSFL